MAQTLNILILGKDPTLFSKEKNTFGDTRKRHIAYAAALQQKHPESEIRIITYTPAPEIILTEKVCDGLRIYGTNSINRATYLWGILKRLPAVLADGWRPDVVTAQTPWEEGSLGYWISRGLRARFIPQLHFDIFSEEWKRESLLNPWRKKTAFRLFRRAAVIRVVSNKQREKLMDYWCIAGNKISVVPVGVNFRPVNGPKSGFKKRIADKLEGKKVVLFAGRFHAQKNLALWVDAAEKISRQVPDAAFVLAGDGPLLDNIKSRVRERRMWDKFYFPGSIAHDQLPSIYAASDIFLLSSNYEGLPRVIVESYLSGIPVVSTMCNGPEDLIDHGITGFLAPCKDSDGLAEAVVRLLEDDGMRERFGRLGNRKITESFSLDVLAGKLISCWEGA